MLDRLKKISQLLSDTDSKQTIDNEFRRQKFMQLLLEDRIITFKRLKECWTDMQRNDKDFKDRILLHSKLTVFTMHDCRFKSY